MTDARLDALIEFCREGERVSLRPREWGQFWKTLPGRRPLWNGEWSPAMPPILGFWASTSDEDKARLLEEHLRWAAAHEVLAEAEAFLKALPEEAWYRKGEPLSLIKRA